MPTEKRQRQKEARQQRQEQLRTAQIRAARRRSGIRLAVIMVVVIGLLTLFGVFSGDGDSDTTVTTKSGLDYGPTACPPTKGAAKRTTTFAAPFERCIDEGKKYTAIMKTDVGTIEIELDAKLAPLTVNNIVALARHRFYDGVPFHRVIKDFVVQGGDAAKGDGTGGPGFTIKDELPKPSQYRAGSLAMANSGPDTNGSQFFIVTSANGAKTLVSAVGGKANYTLFGRVTNGMDVVKKIEADGSDSGTPAVVHKIVTLTIKEK